MVALKCVYVGFLFSLCLGFNFAHRFPLLPDHHDQKLEDTHHVDGAGKGIRSSSGSGSIGVGAVVGSESGGNGYGYRVGFGPGGLIPGWPGFGLGGGIGIGPGIGGVGAVPGYPGYGIGIVQGSGSGRDSNTGLWVGVPASRVIPGNGQIGNGCTCTPAFYQGMHKGGAGFNEEPYRGGTRKMDTRDYVEASEPPNN